MKRSIFLGILLGIAAVLVLGNRVYAADFFKIGVITSLSGDLATGGNVTKRGYDHWAMKVNKRGGIEIGGKRYTVKLFYADAQSEPSQGASAAERLATMEKVDFVFGPYSSGVTLATAPVLEKHKIPMITGSAESPIIWRQKFFYTFGTIPPVSYTGSDPIKTIAGFKPLPKTIVILGSNDAFSKATAETFKAVAQEQGLKIMKYNIVPAGQDLIPYMSAVKVLRPDLIAFGGHDVELINLVKSLRQIDYTPNALVMHYGVTEPAFVEALGKDAEQVYGATVWTEATKTRGTLWPDAKSYADAAMRLFEVPTDYTQAACTATGVAFEAAVQKTQATPPFSEAEREALVKALEEVDIQTFYGRVNYAAEGEFYHSNVGLDPLTVQVQNGKIVTVGPKKYQEAPAQYPMTPWRER